jgi:hypothetical protein
MAAEVKIVCRCEVTGLGDSVSVKKSFVSGTTPAETVNSRASVADSAFTLDLGDIAAGSGFLLYLRAITGNFYFKLGETSGTPAAADSHLYIPEGEAYVIPITPNATSMPGVRGISDSSSGELEYMLIGS